MTSNFYKLLEIKGSKMGFSQRCH